MAPNFSEISSFARSCNDASKRFPVHSPATGRVLTKIQAGDASTAETAVKAAHKAYQSDGRWRSPTERSKLLLKCAYELEKHSEELAEILRPENGKPYQNALTYDVSFVSEIFRYFGSLCDKLLSISPFNWPPIHTGGNIAPAIAVGNTIVLKPGEQAPLTVMRIVEILQSVLPLNVVQAVPGLGPDIPQVLCSHPLVKKISLTGSTAAGAVAAKTAASHVIPSTLEFGGKNAFIIFEDANLDGAISDSLEGAFFNKGQACTAS